MVVGLLDLNGAGVRWLPGGWEVGGGRWGAGGWEVGGGYVGV